MSKTEEFRNTSIDELKALHTDACRVYFDMKNELIASKKLEQPHRIKQKRKEIARMLTVLREKELSEEK